MLSTLYLQAKLVEAVAEQVLDAEEQALVQVVPLGVGEEGGDVGGRALQLLVVVGLVPVHRGLKHQQQQHQQVILGEYTEYKAKDIIYLE